MDRPKILLLTHRYKDYWASSYGQTRLHTVITSESQKFPKLFRKILLDQFTLALRGRAIARRFDVIVCVDRHLALIMGMLQQTSRLNTPVIAYQFILPDKDDAQRKFMAHQWDISASRGLKRIIVNSSHEESEYADRLKAWGRTVFVSLGVAPLLFEIPLQPSSAPKIFSGGTSIRDYPTLFRAVQDSEYQVEVITQTPENLEQAILPTNIHVRYQLPFHDFLQEMATSHLVVIPLHHTNRAAGQGTIVYAQSLGLTVITSDVPSVRDYIAHGVNGWLVPPEDPKALTQAIVELMTNSDLRSGISNSARLYAQENYSFSAYDSRIAKVITAALS